MSIFLCRYFARSDKDVLYSYWRLNASTFFIFLNLYQFSVIHTHPICKWDVCGWQRIDINSKKWKKCLHLISNTSIVRPCRSEQSNDTKKYSCSFWKTFSKTFSKSFKKSCWQKLINKVLYKSCRIESNTTYKDETTTKTTVIFLLLNKWIKMTTPKILLKIIFGRINEFYSNDSTQTKQ